MAPWCLKWGKLIRRYPQLRFERWYLEMAMGGPLFQEIMAKSWEIGHFHKRPSSRGLIEAKHPIFLTHFHGGEKSATLRNSYPRLGCEKGYIEMAMGDPLFPGILGNHGQSNPPLSPTTPPLFGP